jgi:cyclase
MRRVRVIPSLLVQNGGLVKSVRFKDHIYVGDPINAIRIFNEKEVDEIIIQDISATAEKRGPAMEMIRNFASEAFMPLGYGGGVTKLGEIDQLISSGVEKVILNTSAFRNPDLVRQGANYCGSQSIVVSIDVRKNFFGRSRVYIRNGQTTTGLDPIEFAKKMEDLGAGELIVNSVERDGTYRGYDTALLRTVSDAVKIPVVAVGGAGAVPDFVDAVTHGASAVAAGSMFVFQRPHRAVLISYPSQQELKENLFSKI